MKEIIAFCCLVASIFINLSVSESMLEYFELYQKMVYANDTLEKDFVQERALYAECMQLTYHVPTNLKVDRRLLK